MTIASILLLIAFVLFACSAANVSSRINLTAAGLAFLTASMLVGARLLG